MPLLPNYIAKNIETPDGSISFTKDGIVIAHSSGNRITIGQTSVELNCGGASIRMTQSEIVINSGTSTLSLSPAASILSSSGPIKVTGAFVNVNNGALEVI
jgi:hypothetical protein